MVAFSNVVVNTTGTGSAPAGTITATGNVTGGNFVTSGFVRATSVVANVVGVTVTTTANVQAGNLRTTGLISSTGNVTGGNLFTVGSVSAQNTIFGPSASITGAITAGTLNVGTLTLASVTTAGNVTGGNLITGGNVSTTGQIVGGNVSATNIVSAPTINGTNFSATGNVRGSYFIGNGGQLTGINGPAFIATGTNQSIPASPSTVSILPLIFTGVTKNINSGYNASTGIFTAPVAGFYQVSATMGVNPPYSPPPPAAGALILYQSGTAIEAGSYISAITVGGTTVINSSSVSRLVYLNVGNTLQCALAYIGGAGWSTNTNLIPGSFQACWLRP